MQCSGIFLPFESLLFEAFMYTSKTSNSEYDGKWNCQGAYFLDGKVIPPINEILGKYKKRQQNPKQVSSSPLAIAPVRCTAFPVKYPDQIRYPKIDKKGVDNPVYFTSSSEIGCQPPNEAQIPDRYFPKSNWFSQSFANRVKLSAGLNTSTSKSNVHNSLDETY